MSRERRIDLALGAMFAGLIYAGCTAAGHVLFHRAML